MTNITATENVKYIPTLIAQKALGRFASYMNLGKTVSRNFDTAPASFGQVLKLPKRGTVTAYSKTQGSNVTVQNPTATDVSVSLDQHFEVTIGIEDVAKVLSNQDVIVGYAEDAAIALAEKIENALSELYASIPIGQVASFNETSDATKEQSFYEVRERLAILKVPKLEQKYGYFHPTLISKLLRLDKFSRADALGGANQGAQIEGKLGRLGGIDIFESQMVIGTGSPAQYHNLIYTRNAFTLASRPLPTYNGLGVQQEVINDPNVNMGLRVTSSYDPNALAMQVTLDVLFGVAINDNRCVVELRSA